MAKNETFKADWQQDLIQIEEPTQTIPWINEQQINQDISIET